MDSNAVKITKFVAQTGTNLKQASDILQGLYNFDDNYNGRVL